MVGIFSQIARRAARVCHGGVSSTAQNQAAAVFNNSWRSKSFNVRLAFDRHENPHTRIISPRMIGSPASCLRCQYISALRRAAVNCPAGRPLMASSLALQCPSPQLPKSAPQSAFPCAAVRSALALPWRISTFPQFQHLRGCCWPWSSSRAPQRQAISLVLVISPIRSWGFGDFNGDGDMVILDSQSFSQIIGCCLSGELAVIVTEYP